MGDSLFFVNHKISNIYSILLLQFEIFNLEVKNVGEDDEYINSLYE